MSRRRREAQGTLAVSRMHSAPTPEIVPIALRTAFSNGTTPAQLSQACGVAPEKLEFFAEGKTPSPNVAASIGQGFSKLRIR